MSERCVEYLKRPHAAAAEVARAIAVANIDMKESAARLGVSPSYLSRVMTGAKSPSAALVAKLIEDFGADSRAFERWDAEDFAELVRVAKMELGITSVYLAELSGVGLRTLMAVEHAERVPQRLTLTRLSEALVALANEKALVCESARSLARISESAGRPEGRS